jgi:hypothetical protein
MNVCRFALMKCLYHEFEHAFSKMLTSLLKVDFTHTHTHTHTCMHVWSAYHAFQRTFHKILWPILKVHLVHPRPHQWGESNWRQRELAGGCLNVYIDVCVCMMYVYAWCMCMHDVCVCMMYVFRREEACDAGWCDYIYMYVCGNWFLVHPRPHLWGESNWRQIGVKLAAARACWTLFECIFMSMCMHVMFMYVCVQKRRSLPCRMMRLCVCLCGNFPDDNDRWALCMWMYVCMNEDKCEVYGQNRYIMVRIDTLWSQ